MNMKSIMDKNFKRGAGKPLIMCGILSILGTYLAMGAMYKVGNGGDFDTTLMQPIKTISFVFHDADLASIFPFIPFVLFGALVYMMRASIMKNIMKDASDFGLHGTSRWGTFAEVIRNDAKILSTKNKYTRTDMSALDMESGIVIAKIPHKNELLIIPEDTSIDNRNVLVIGSSGSGKGQAFVFNNVINQTKQTIVITDPKGEIYNATHQLKRDQGYKVYLLDFVDFDPRNGYNPLDYVKDDEDARAVANIIASNATDDSKRDFWSESAIAYFAAIILYIKTEKGKNATMRDIVRFTAKAGKNEDFIDELLAEMDESHPAYAMFDLANMSSGNTRSGIMSTLAQQLGIFALQKIATFTDKSGFDFHDMQKQKTVLYIKVRMKTNPFKQLTATFFEQLIDVFYDIASKNNSLLPIASTFLLDEFANIGKINSYPNVLSTCRGLLLSLNTIIQDLGQLEDKSLYGAEQARTIINNHDTVLYLRTKDEKTAKYFSGVAGDTTVQHRQKSTSVGHKSSSKSYSEQHVKRPLITPGELMNIDKDTCYVFISGFFPIKAEKAYQYKIYGNFLFKNRIPNYEQESRSKFLAKYNLEMTPLADADPIFVDRSEMTDEEAKLQEEQINNQLEQELANIEKIVDEETTNLELSEQERIKKELEDAFDFEEPVNLNKVDTIDRVVVDTTDIDEDEGISDEELEALLNEPDPNDASAAETESEEIVVPENANEELDEMEALFNNISNELMELEEADVPDDILAEASKDILAEADTDIDTDKEIKSEPVATSSDDDLPM